MDAVPVSYSQNKAIEIKRCSTIDAGWCSGFLLSDVSILWVVLFLLVQSTNSANWPWSSGLAQNLNFPLLGRDLFKFFLFSFFFLFNWKRIDIHISHRKKFIYIIQKKFIKLFIIYFLMYMTMSCSSLFFICSKIFAALVFLLTYQLIFRVFSKKKNLFSENQNKF